MGAPVKFRPFQRPVPARQPRTTRNVAPDSRPVDHHAPLRRGSCHSALRSLGSNGTPVDEQHVEHFVEFAAGRGIDTAQVWLAVRSAEPSARDGAVIHAALLPIVSPGRTMLLLGGRRRVKPAAVPDR